MRAFSSRRPCGHGPTWAMIIGLEPPAETADGAAIAFSRWTIQFVPAAGDRSGIVAVDLHATDRQHNTCGVPELGHWS